MNQVKHTQKYMRQEFPYTLENVWKTKKGKHTLKNFNLKQTAGITVPCQLKLSAL